MQDDSASSLPPPLHQASPSVTRSQPGGNRASNEAEATERPVRKALDPSLPRALRDAARVGNAREVESLIGQGVPVDGRDTAGRTALMIAALNGHTAAVQKLLALGAHTSLVDGDGLTASQHARRWGYSAIADLIDAAR
jgi:ankyrin repeat protein